MCWQEYEKCRLSHITWLRKGMRMHEMTFEQHPVCGCTSKNSCSCWLLIRGSVEVFASRNLVRSEKDYLCICKHCGVPRGRFGGIGSVNCLNIEENCLIEWVIKGTSVVNRISTGFFYGLGFFNIPTGWCQFFLETGNEVFSNFVVSWDPHNTTFMFCSKLKRVCPHINLCVM